MQPITLVPTYRRDKSLEQVVSDFESNVYFVVRTLGHPLDGLFMNRHELIAQGERLVKLLYHGCQKHTTLALPDDVYDTQLSLPMEYHD